MPDYEIRNEFGEYVLYKRGIFVNSFDTIEEAAKALEDLRKEEQ